MSGIFQTLLGSLAGAVKDTFFRYVTLLLPGNGTNGAQNNTFTDASTNNFTVTRNGNTTQGTFSPYGANWSNYFDGTGDYLTVADNAAFALGSGDFTIEAWVLPTSTVATNSISNVCSQYVEGGSRSFLFALYNNAGTMQLLFQPVSGATETAISYNATFNVGEWVHIAAVRNGNNVTLYRNGTSLGTTAYSSAINDANNDYLIGCRYNAGVTPALFFTGYISNHRLVKGTAVYTANFTPPTAPLTAITNTALLTCQSNRFIDNSTNAFTITRNGDVSVQRFSPFSPTGAYSASVIGGSGYFDGAGDYLTVADNAALDMGASNFTIELWLYLLSTPASVVTVFSKRANSGDFNGISLYFSSNTTPAIVATTSGSNWEVNVTSSISLSLSAWAHIAVVRNGNVWTLYVNGVSGGSQTVSGTVPDNASAFAVGAGAADGAQVLPTSYISNFRVVKGTVVYTAGFTPPTAPLTAITNTSLLLNFTNAGIIDNAMMNDLETVGNAQISTAQSKFGGSSMLFDGTGDWLTTVNSTQLNFGTGDFTVEMWVYTSNLAAFQTLIDARASNSTLPWALFIDNTGKPYWYDASGTQLSSTAISSNTWTHLAVSRSGSTLRMFLGGTQVFSGTNTNSQNSTGVFYIGRNFDNNALYIGYIDDLRITKGVARYTANFTPPGSAFPLL
jgi:hypothetical protein